MDEFLLRAGLGGLTVALAAGPIGSLMLWRRMTFFGATVAHSAVLGVTLGLLIGLHPVGGAVAVCLILALTLDLLSRRTQVTDDTLVGVVGHGALALAMVLLVYLSRVRVDLIGYLFGDILAVTWSEIWITLAGALAALGALAFFWRPILAATADPEIAAAEGVPVDRVSLFFMVLLAGVVALGLKLAGALLIIALLVMPAAAARAFARSPIQMAALATVIGALAVIIGLAFSWFLDWPAGPAIALAGTVLFLLSLLARR